MVWSSSKEAHGSTVMKTDCLEVMGISRGRGRFKKTWIGIVRNDLKVIKLTDKIALCRIEKKCQIKCGRPQVIGVKFDDDDE